MTNKGLDQTFMSFFYTHTMFASQYNDTTWVNDTLFSFAPLIVNATLANETAFNDAIMMKRSAIVNDTRYGMSSQGNLTIWVSATLGTTESIATLKSHWFSGVYQISDDWLNMLTNNTNS